MVKKAETQRKRGALTPVFGLLLAVGLFAIAYVLSDGVVMHMPAVRATLVDNSTKGTATIAFAVGIWVIFLALGYFVVAILAGKDPEDAKQIPLPTKQKDLKKKKR